MSPSGQLIPDLSPSGSLQKTVHQVPLSSSYTGSSSIEVPVPRTNSVTDVPIHQRTPSLGTLQQTQGRRTPPTPSRDILQGTSPQSWASISPGAAQLVSPIPTPVESVPRSPSYPGVNLTASNSNMTRLEAATSTPTRLEASSPKEDVRSELAALQVFGKEAEQKVAKCNQELEAAYAERAEAMAQCKEELAAAYAQSKLDTDLSKQQASQNALYEKEVAILRQDLAAKSRLLGETEQEFKWMQKQLQQVVGQNEQELQALQTENAALRSNLSEVESNAEQAKSDLSSRHREVLSQLQHVTTELSNIKDASLTSQKEAAVAKIAIAENDSLKQLNEALRDQVMGLERQLLDQSKIAADNSEVSPPRDVPSGPSVTEFEQLKEQLKDTEAHAQAQKRLTGSVERKLLRAEEEISQLKERVAELLKASEKSFTQEPNAAEFEQLRQLVQDAEAHAQEQKHLADTAESKRALAVKMASSAEARAAGAEAEVVQLKQHIADLKELSKAEGHKVVASQQPNGTLLSAKLVLADAQLITLTRHVKVLEQQVGTDGFTEGPSAEEIEQLNERITNAERIAQEQVNLAQAANAKLAVAANRVRSAEIEIEQCRERITDLMKAGAVTQGSYLDIIVDRNQKLEQDLANEQRTHEEHLQELNELIKDAERDAVAEQIKAEGHRQKKEEKENRIRSAEAEVVQCQDEIDQLKNRVAELSLAADVTKDSYLICLAGRVQELEQKGGSQERLPQSENPGVQIESTKEASVAEKLPTSPPTSPASLAKKLTRTVTCNHFEGWPPAGYFGSNFVEQGRPPEASPDFRPVFREH